MGATNFDGPAFVYGNMGGLAAGYGDATPDYNGDAGPSMTFMGDFLPDVRYPFLKDKIQGYTGVVPGHLNTPLVVMVDAVPAAKSTTNVAAAQALVAATPMTLASAQVAGVTPNVPIRPNTSPFALNSGALTNILALDFGFAFGNLTAGNASIPVADSTQFTAGEPLVIMQSATSALLTNVLQVVDATHITVGPNIPTANNATAPIGTGNYWGPSPVGFPVPDAWQPYVAAGPGLLWDTRQGIGRALSFTGVSGGTGGNVLVIGYDLYFQLQAELVALPSGAATTFGQKTWRGIVSITPQAGVDTTHNYSVGTSDIFGLSIRSDRIEMVDLFMGASFMSAGAQTQNGWIAAVLTNPSTHSTGDVRGTWQTSNNATSGPTANGWNGLTGAAGQASTGSISSLAMSGNRLMMGMVMVQYDLINSYPASPQFFYGFTPATS